MIQFVLTAHAILCVLPAKELSSHFACCHIMIIISRHYYRKGLLDPYLHQYATIEICIVARDPLGYVKWNMIRDKQMMPFNKSARECVLHSHRMELADQ